MSRISGFPPVAAADARVLILGSMPGVASLRAGEYYAHPRNAFWRIMAEVTGVPAHAGYAQRIAGLCDVGIALWDVVAECQRVGSLDTAIARDSVRANDFVGFLDTHRGIRLVLFNGSAAETLFRRLVLADLCNLPLRYARLPSTSPAHAARGWQEKRDLWLAQLLPALAGSRG